ncbi:MAG: DUF1549 and DUF1553 domain-containing protein, partial [Gemmataceae bacterium]|nr:DUF1549 and DUF1553 domain-containing protein [Gemmataceae bacterium]
MCIRDSSNSVWVRTPIDRFILARLEAAGRSPAPECDRLTWLRRVTFDLTGLPPTVEEQEAFLQDDSPTAYERVVERLLASPHYGERWAQHWLDVVRFAETNGFEVDGDRPHAWLYRDYVVRSLNADKPYDEFIREQVAGDLLVRQWREEVNRGPHRWMVANGWLIPDLTRWVMPERVKDWLIATGLHRCGPVHMVAGNLDVEQVRQEVITEMVNGLGSAVLGLTVGCARCHDHKFDPISQGDYFRLAAFFAGTQFHEVPLASQAEIEEYQRRTSAIRQRTNPLRAKVAALDEPYRKRLVEMKRAALEPHYRAALDTPADKRTPEQKKWAEHAEILIRVSWDEVLAALTPEDRAQRQRWRDEIHSLEAHLPPPPMRAWAVKEIATPPATHILRRGDHHQKWTAVSAGFFRILSTEAQQPARDRLDLAAWLTRPDHPLTARVWVNRIWQHHFGRGLVPTSGDFGVRGEPPTHPDLLDWLASELIRCGWSTKQMHRWMVLSATYRQQSFCTDGTEADPENRLYSRMNRRRLEGEALRDAMLAVAGNLNRSVGGPRVLVPLEPEVYELIFTEGEPDGLWLATPDPRQHVRRSLYLYQKRNVRQPLLEAFDQPDTLNPCPVRAVSTFAPQALILMNGPFARQQSRVFANRLMSLRDSGERLTWAYRAALGRPPRPEEVERVEDFLRRHPGIIGLTDFCLTLFNLNEFVYVD